MPAPEVETEKCEECGGDLPKKGAICRECHPPLTFSTLVTPREDIRAEYKRIRLLWVISVTLFWATIGLLGGIYLVLGSAYLSELLLIAGLFMFAGVYLKTKIVLLQKQMSKGPAKDNG
jgi:hypothetical protein